MDIYQRGMEPVRVVEKGGGALMGSKSEQTRQIWKYNPSQTVESSPGLIYDCCTYL